MMKYWSTNMFLDEDYTGQLFAPFRKAALRNGVRAYYEPDKKQRLDGVSTLSTWLNPAEGPRRDAIYWHYPLEPPHFLGGRSSGAIRRGPWQLLDLYRTVNIEL